VTTDKPCDMGEGPTKASVEGCETMLNVAGASRPPGPLSSRYAILQIEDKRAVLDVWTGEPVVIGAVPQINLDAVSAAELVDYLKRRALRGWAVA
jgi:hypothetical protein